MYERVKTHETAPGWRSPEARRLFGPLVVLEIAALLAGFLLPRRETMGALLILFCAAAGTAIVLASSPREDRRFLAALFIGALGVRLLVGLSVHFTSLAGDGNPLSLPDEERYDRIGRLIAYRVSEFGLGGHWIVEEPIARGYYAFTAFIYSLFGDSPAIMKVIQCALGALLLLPTYATGRLLWNRTVARRSAALVAFYPSLVFWSGRHLKDTLAGLLFTLFLYLEIRILHPGERNRGGAAAALTAIFGALLLIRPYVALLLALVFTLHMLILPSKRRGATAAKILTVFAVFGVAIPLVALSEFAWIGRMGFFSVLEWIHATVLLDSDSAFSRTVFSDWGSLLRFLPAGAARFALTPLPWKAEGIYRALIPEALLRYALIPFTLVGLYHAFRTRFRTAFPVFVVPAILSMIYVVVFLGGGPRHHAQFVPFLALLTFLGLERTGARTALALVWAGALVAGGGVFAFGLKTGGALVALAAAAPFACLLAGMGRANKAGSAGLKIDG